MHVSAVVNYGDLINARVNRLVYYGDLINARVSRCELWRFDQRTRQPL